jgi:hypothetical protein
VIAVGVATTLIMNMQVRSPEPSDDLRTGIVDGLSERPAAR